MTLFYAPGQGSEVRKRLLSTKAGFPELRLVGIRGEGEKDISVHSVGVAGIDKYHAADDGGPSAVN